MAPYRKVVLALIVLVLAVAALAVFEVSRISRNIYVQITESASRGLRDRLILHLTPPLDNLALARGWLTQNGLSLGNPAEAGALLFPILTEQPAVVAVILADARGPGAVFIREGDAFLGAVREEGPTAQLAWQHYEASREATGPAKVDPADVAPMLAALAQVGEKPAPGKPAWSQAYSLPGAPGAVLSASLPVEGKDGAPLVLSIAFSLEDIHRVCAAGLASDSERVALFTPEGKVFDFHPKTKAEPNSRQAMAPMFIDPAQVQDRPLARAAQAWLQSGRPAAQAFAYDVDGATWWTALQPVTDNGDAMLAGVAIAQAELWGEFFAGRAIVLLACLGALVVLGLLGLLAFRRRHPAPGVEDGFYDSAAAVQALIAGGESERLEFKSTLRLNLNSGKPGKEIELAAMKPLAAFMNTDGGTLVVGVDDNGQVLGLEQDGFQNDDHILRHFASLVNQHLGLDCAAYMRFGLRPAGQSKVLIVDCRVSAEPVYVRGGKEEEEFYVRVGPSNRKLSLSQFLGHVARRKTRQQ